MAIEAERRERGLSAAARGGSRERSIHTRSLERGHNRSRSRSIGRQQQGSRSIDNRGSGSQQNQQKADSTHGFYDNDDPEQMIDPSIYTVGDSPNNNEVVGTGGENPLDASTRSEKRVSFQKPSTSSRGGSGMLALGPDNNLSPAEMEAERDPNISWRDGDTSDDGINNLDASHSSRTPHDHPHLEEEGRPTLANDKKKKKQPQKKKTKRQFKGFIKKKKKSNNEMMPLDDGTSTRGKRSRKFYMCVALLLLVVGGIIAGIVYMIQEMTSTNNTDKNTSSTTKDETQLLNCHGMLYST